MAHNLSQAPKKTSGFAILILAIILIIPLAGQGGGSTGCQATAVKRVPGQLVCKAGEIQFDVLSLGNTLGVNANAASSTISPGVINIAGDFVIVTAVSTNQSPDAAVITSLSDNFGDSYTFAGNRGLTNGTTTLWEEMWSAQLVQTGSLTVTGTWNMTAQNVGLLLQAYQNVFQLSGFAANSGTGVLANTTSAVTIQSAWLVGSVLFTGTATPPLTPLAGYSQVTDFAGNQAGEVVQADTVSGGPFHPGGFPTNELIGGKITGTIPTGWIAVAVQLIPLSPVTHTNPFIRFTTISSKVLDSSLGSRFQVIYASACCNSAPIAPASPGDQLICIATLNFVSNQTNPETVAFSFNDTTSNNAFARTRTTVSNTNPQAITYSGIIGLSTAFDGIAVEISFQASTNTKFTFTGGLFGSTFNCVDTA